MPHEPELLLDGKVSLYCGDSREVLKSIADCSIDSIVTDPPYALVSISKRFGKDGAAPAKSSGASGVYKRASSGFMGVQWDTGETAFAAEFWAEVLRVLKPGGHVVAFSGTRTYHRMVCAIEDAGFEIRDQLAWAFGSGFPKSHNVSKQIDKMLGAEREKVRIPAKGRIGSVNTVGGDIKGSGRPWIDAAKEKGYHELDGDEAVTDQARSADGWGTALKPAWEPICLGRKPIDGTVAENFLQHGTGAIHVGACRVGSAGGTASAGTPNYKNEVYGKGMGGLDIVDLGKGRWPANMLLDGSEETTEAFPLAQDQDGNMVSASRYFYTAKADTDERLGSKHPTVKPTDLMQWLVRLVTPKGGVCLDPFAGTGTTGEAAWREGMRSVLIEREPEYQNDIRRRMSLVLGGPEERHRVAMKPREKPVDDLPLFGGGGDQTGGAHRQIYGAFADEKGRRTNNRPDLSQTLKEDKLL